ncbi:MAG TPA: S8 family serine peptidase [Pseudonocardiaceae bacterium]|jgi:subtilisin family serine protease
MADQEIITELPNTFQSDEVVVNLPDLDVVTALLAELDVRPDGEPEADESLGLALLKLTQVAPDGGHTAVTDLDSVLTEIRRRSAARYEQWEPLVGKNRYMAGVVGFPQPRSHGIDDLAVVLDPPPLPPVPRAGHGVRVGVLDTNVDGHPDLVGRFVADRDSRYRPLPEPVPRRAGHATFVSSVILSLAQGATLQVRGVLDPTGTATAWDTARAMMTFADSGVDILNVSLGCRTVDGQPPLLMARAAALLSQRMLIVAAAGNHGMSVESTAPTWPAALPDVIAVGAREADGMISDFSPKLPWVTCTAPGRKVVGAYLTALVAMFEGDPQKFCGYARWSGTSFAAAKVSGAIAARTVPGRVTPRAAFAALLADPHGVVRKYV